MAAAMTRRDVSVGGLRRGADRPWQNGPKPGLARDGVVRWRCVGLQDRIKRE